MTRWIKIATVLFGIAVVGLFCYNRFFSPDDAVGKPVDTGGVVGLYWSERAEDKEHRFSFYLRPTAKEGIWHLSGDYYDAKGEFLPFEDTVVDAAQWAEVEAILQQTAFFEASKSGSGNQDADAPIVSFLLYFADGGSKTVSPPDSETCSELHDLLLSAAEA